MTTTETEIPALTRGQLEALGFTFHAGIDGTYGPDNGPHGWSYQAPDTRNPTRSMGGFRTEAEVLADANRFAHLVNSRGRIAADLRAAEPVVPPELAALVPGSRWVWEPLKPYATAVVEIVQLSKPNGRREWQVQTKRIAQPFQPAPAMPLVWNDASRFIEAAVLLETSGLIDDEPRTHA